MKSQEHYDEQDRELYDWLEAGVSDLLYGLQLPGNEPEEMRFLNTIGAQRIQLLILQKINWQLNRIAHALEGLEGKK